MRAEKSAPSEAERLAPADAFADAIRRALDERRGFLLFPFALMTGLILYRLPNVEPNPVAVILLTLAAAGWLVAVRWQKRRGVVAQIVFGLALGFAILPLHGLLFGTDMLHGSRFGMFEARVDEILSASETEQRLILSHLKAPNGRDPGPRRVRLFVRNGPQLAPGDIVSAKMRLAEVPGPAIPGGYDAQFHSYFAGIGAYGTSIGTPEILRHETAGLSELVDGLRRGIGIRIDKTLTGRPAAVARALTIGDQSRIDDDTRDTMATAGIAHVLAISGLHLSLVAGGAFAAFRALFAVSQRFSQHVAVKKLAALAGIAVVLVYLAISGASVSATRASVMLILVFGAMLAGRQALTMRNVALAALFLLIVEPAGVFRPSFQLSFAAVAALIGAYEQARRRDRYADGWGYRVWQFFAGLMATSLIAGLATAPFAAFHFQQTAPLGLVGNLFAIPLLGFLILPCLTLGVLVMPLGLEAPFLDLAGWGITQVLNDAELVAIASRAIAFRPLLATNVLLFSLGAMAWFVFFTGRLRLLGPAVALVLILGWGVAPVPDVLVSDRTQATGFRDGDILHLVTGRSKSFITDVWAETYGLNVVTGGKTIACDKRGCIGTAANGTRLAVDKDISAFIEDCDVVDLVVTRLKAPVWCRETTNVIDGSDLARGGVVAGYWRKDTGTYDLVSAITDPDRPWRIAE